MEASTASNEWTADAACEGSDQLNWVATKVDIREIIASAWRWFERNPTGYSKR